VRSALHLPSPVRASVVREALQKAFDADRGFDKARMAAEFAALTPEQRDTVSALSGGDADKQFEVLRKLKSTWKLPPVALADPAAQQVSGAIDAVDMALAHTQGSLVSVSITGTTDPVDENVTGRVAIHIDFLAEPVQ